MPNILPTKYRVKIALYRTKSFLRGAFSTSRGGIKKRARLLSFLAVFVVAGLILSLSIYGLNLKGGAVGETKISATDTYYLGNYDTTDTLGWRTKALPSGFTPTFIGTCNSADSNYGGEIYLVDEINNVVKGMANADSNFINNSFTDISSPSGEQIYKSACNGDNLIVLTKGGRVYYLPNFTSTWTLIKKNTSTTNYNLFTDMGITAADLLDFYTGYQGNTGAVHYHLLSATKALDFYADTTVRVFTITGIPVGEIPQQTLTLYSNDVGVHDRYIMTDKGKLYLSSIANANMTFVADYKTPSTYNVFDPGSSSANFEAIKHFSVQIPVGQYQSLFTQSHKLADGVYLNYFRTQGSVQTAPDTATVSTRYSFAGCKPLNVFTRSWGGSVSNNRYITIFGSGCADPTNPVVPPSTTTNNIANTYDYNYKGVSIHTKAETLNPDGVTPRGDTTTKKGVGDKVKFTLTVSNADVAKQVDVKFTLPAGFSYSNSVSGPAPLQASGATGLLTWAPYNAPKGDSTIVFDTNAP